MAVALLIVLNLVLATGSVATSQQVPDSLVFERGGDLYRITIDASETVRITATEAFESEPTVSGNRLSVAYQRETAAQPASIWTMNVTGGRSRRITRSVGDSDPHWSTDGPIYFTRYYANSFGEECGSIFRVRPDGSGLARIKRGTSSDLTPAVSPDGTRVAFADVDLCAGGVAKLTLGVIDSRGRPTSETARVERATRSTGAWQPTWSPDGEQIAFTTLGGSELFVIDANGANLRRVGRNLSRAQIRDPAWSPDGEWIAFAGANRKSYDIYLVRPDGTGLRRVTRTNYANERSVAWLPRT